jgi:hypothetical protein
MESEEENLIVSLKQTYDFVKANNIFFYFLPLPPHTNTYFAIVSINDGLMFLIQFEFKITISGRVYIVYSIIIVLWRLDIVKVKEQKVGLFNQKFRK